ncbi:MAG: LptF/LptG family permease [Ignavibacteriae bacterium]|nr:LptF/LptG family permease [Ignavibacteriota bacterium]
MKIHLLPKHLHLSKYLLRAHIGPFLFSLSTLMFLFMLQFVMKFIDQLVGKGLSAWLIIELISLNLAWMVVLAVPMSVLVATLMAFGDLSSRNEITAMKASGVSIYRMIGPVFFVAGILAILLVFFNNDVLPEANHRAKTLTIDIRRKKPTLSLVAGLFSQDIAGYSILVHKTFEKTNDLEGITIYDYTNPTTNVVITAERGKISFSPDYHKLIMDLQMGEIHELDLQDMSGYKKIRFENHRIAMNVEGFDFERSAEGTFTRSDRELSAQVMIGIVDSIKKETDKIEQQLRERMEQEMENLLTRKPPPSLFGTFGTPGGGLTAGLNRARVTSSMLNNELLRIEYLEKQMDQYKVEIHKKYSIPAACLVFVMIGVPLGIMARRGGFGIAATLSFGFFLLYWAFLIGGEKLADRGITSPFWGMWSANILLAIVGIYLVIRIGRETVVIDWRQLHRLIPKRWRSDLPEEEGVVVE